MDSELAGTRFLCPIFCIDQTPDHEPERVGLELATEHYCFKSIAQWVRAGFLIYARVGGANLHRLQDTEPARIPPKFKQREAKSNPFLSDANLTVVPSAQSRREEK